MIFTAHERRFDKIICPSRNQTQALFNQPCGHTLAQNIHYCFVRWAFKEPKAFGDPCRISMATGGVSTEATQIRQQQSTLFFYLLRCISHLIGWPWEHACEPDLGLYGAFLGIHIIDIFLLTDLISQGAWLEFAFHKSLFLPRSELGFSDQVYLERWTLQMDHRICYISEWRWVWLQWDWSSVSI